jgi:hypothetical protein
VDERRQLKTIDFLRPARYLARDLPGTGEASRMKLHPTVFNPRHGLSCPVIVPASVDWERDYTQVTLTDLLGMTDRDLATVDPLAMNLIIAKGIPSLADLEVCRYQEMVNDWVSDFTRRCLPRWEPCFHQTPQDFEDDIRFFRLGMVTQYLDLEVGVQYNLN